MPAPKAKAKAKAAPAPIQMSADQFANLLAQLGGGDVGGGSKARVSNPPSFDGAKPAPEQYFKVLAAWNSAFPNVKNKGALLYPPRVEQRVP
jgi:hypothetical protein